MRRIALSSGVGLVASLLSGFAAVWLNLRLRANLGGTYWYTQAHQHYVTLGRGSALVASVCTAALIGTLAIAAHGEEPGNTRKALGGLVVVGLVVAVFGGLVLVVAPGPHLAEDDDPITGFAEVAFGLVPAIGGLVVAGTALLAFVVSSVTRLVRPSDRTPRL